MKTATELAEEIVDNYFGNIIPMPREGCAGLVSLIAQALTAFAAEQVKEVERKWGIKYVEQRCVDLVEGYKDGRSDALEQAAKRLGELDWEAMAEHEIIREIVSLKSEP